MGNKIYIVGSFLQVDKNLWSSKIIVYDCSNDKRFASDSILKVKAYRGSKYIVTIDNRSNKTLSGKVKINSYVR